MAIPPLPIRIETLRARHAGCVSDRLPIVCYEDRAGYPDQARGFVHADFLSVYVARGGSGVHLVEDVPFEVRAGDVYAMGYGMSHRFENADDLVLDTVHFVPSMFSPETQATLAATEGLAPLFLGDPGAGSSRWLRLTPAAHGQAIGMLGDMRGEWEVDAPDRALMVQATFLRLLVFLARCHRSARGSESRLVSRTRAIIESRYAEPLRIGDLAASAFLSTGRFTEVFREEVGCSPREYLGQVRIHAARKLLRQTALPVSHVALRTGFPDPSYFTRFFRQQVGVSPSEFRERPLLDPAGEIP